MAKPRAVLPSRSVAFISAPLSMASIILGYPSRPFLACAKVYHKNSVLFSKAINAALASSFPCISAKSIASSPLGLVRLKLTPLLPNKLIMFI